MIRWVLRKFGYYKIRYGFAIGRHWVEIDGKTMAQAPGEAIWMRDEDVHRIGYIAIDHGRHWSTPPPPTRDVAAEIRNLAP